jgi:hypothetical protein
LWVVLLVSILFYFVILQMLPVAPSDAALPDSALLIVAAALVGASVFARNLFLRKARETTDPAHLRTATVVGAVLCESAALLGIVAHFVSGSPVAWRYIVIGAAGMLLHFPRREDLG